MFQWHDARYFVPLGVEVILEWGMPAVTQLEREVTANYTNVSHQTQTKYSQVDFLKNVRNYPIWGKCDRGLIGMERHSSVNQLQFKIILFWTSPVIQWIRICLPMQGTWVWSWSRTIPHATEQLSLGTTSPEPTPEGWAPRDCAL